MLAVKSSSSGDEDYLAAPLAWSHPHREEDIPIQFVSATNAMKKVFGMSEVDVAWSRLLYSRQGQQPPSMSEATRCVEELSIAPVA